jgi:hypothetical protein
MAISPMDFRFPGKSGRAADITGMTEVDQTGHSSDLRSGLQDQV